MHTSGYCWAFAAGTMMIWISTTSPATAHPLHAGIDYQKYLEAIDTTQADLDEWRSKYGEVAQKNGWWPVSKDRSADDQEEDLRQRIFLTKQSISAVQAANPNANFSIMTPFSAMTDTEFDTYVLNSYIGGNSVQSDSGTTKYQLRTATGTASTTDVNDKSSNTVSLIKSIGSFIETLIKSLSTGTAQSLSNSRADVNLTSYKFSDLVNWLRVTLKIPTLTANTPVTDASSSSETTLNSSASVDWSTSECMAPIQNQGSCGSCWAFATVSAVESAQCIANGKSSLTEYSVQQLVSCDTRNWGCDGGILAYAFDFILQNGLCTEDSYPYTSSRGVENSCSSSCTSQDTGITGYSQLSGEAELLSAIDEHPVVVAVAAGNIVWKQYTGGLVSSCSSTQLDHAVVAVGYDSSSIKIRNSWGTNWGEDGYMRLARSSSGDGTCEPARSKHKDEHSVH
ncbi:unnamed protein product [Peronospora belbahrii]|uniref:Peptidase C1A papain C-terminal domain-containing protein n=2 Tax=Peronospora belbahrii TaxID=622444 RepID=A0ABN8D2B7_9STRA|nr:unnamed protein product [Peronospora belbahrii]